MGGWQVKHMPPLLLLLSETGGPAWRPTPGRIAPNAHCPPSFQRLQEAAEKLRQLEAERDGLQGENRRLEGDEGWPLRTPRGVRGRQPSLETTVPHTPSFEQLWAVSVVFCFQNNLF